MMLMNDLISGTTPHRAPPSRRAAPRPGSSPAGKTTPSVAAVGGRHALATLGLWLGSAAVLGSAGYAAAGAALPADAEARTLVAVFAAYLTLPLAALVINRPSGLRDRLAVRPAGGRAYGTAVLIWLVALLVTAGLYLIFGVAAGDPAAPFLSVIHDATDYSRFPGATGLDWTLIVPRALLLAGVTEELLFRGILLGWLRARLPWWPAALISAALFAVFHYYVALIPLTLIFGIGLAWLREHTQSILPGLLVHILTDSLLFALALGIS